MATMTRAITAAIADAVLTFMWVFCASMIGLGTSILRNAIGIQTGYEFYGLELTSIAISTGIIFVLVFIFNIVAGLIGGASFNPTGTAAFYAVGAGSDTLLSMALRFPAQAAGAVGGALAVMEVIPTYYKHMIGGPKLKVDLHTGAVAEGVLTFMITFAVLLIILKGPRNSVIQAFLLAVATMVFVMAGAAYTGPSMNPANAYGWAYQNNWHNTWEHFYVYWLCPFAGAILAAWLFRAIVPFGVKKQRKAKTKAKAKAKAKRA